MYVVRWIVLSKARTAALSVGSGISKVYSAKKVEITFDAWRKFSDQIVGQMLGGENIQISRSRMKLTEKQSIGHVLQTKN